eukprot:gene17527-19277_t
MQLNWGILGAGNVAHDFAIALRVLPRKEHQLVAIASRCEQKAKKFAALHKVPKSYGSYWQLVNDETINIVYVATLNHTHKHAVMMALDHGKHVLCEKPLAVNRTEAEDMMRFAKEKRLFLMEGIWSYFLPSWMEMASQIESGAIGQPRFINIMHARKCYASKEKFYSKDLAGGMLTTLGEYALALMYMVFNGEEPVKIVASGNHFNSGVDKSISVSMSFRNGAMTTFFISCDFDYLENAEVIGSEAILEFEMPKPDMQSKFANCTGFSYEAEHVRQCLEYGWIESDVIPHKTSSKIIKWMDEIRKQLGVVYEQDEISR